MLGSPEDVHTAAGDYADYRVVRPCALAGADLGVRGTGSVVPAQAMITAAGSELLQLVGDLRLSRPSTPRRPVSSQWRRAWPGCPGGL